MSKVQNVKNDSLRQTYDRRQTKLRSNTHGCELTKARLIWSLFPQQQTSTASDILFEFDWIIFW